MSEEKTFDELFKAAKARGLSDWDAINEANDKYTLDYLRWHSAEDADFEVIEPLQLPESKK